VSAIFAQSKFFGVINLQSQDSLHHRVILRVTDLNSKLSLSGLGDHISRKICQTGRGLDENLLEICALDPGVIPNKLAITRVKKISRH
jgi:hypothetical protein